jgi:hypothetical protein
MAFGIWCLIGMSRSVLGVRHLKGVKTPFEGRDCSHFYKELVGMGFNFTP